MWTEMALALVPTALLMALLARASGHGARPLLRPLLAGAAATVPACALSMAAEAALCNQTSQWFALYYLDPVDRIIKEQYRVKYYTRYMDDLVLVHESREHLERVLREIRSYARCELRLSFSEKTQIHPLSQGVDYVGWHYYLTDTGKVIKRLRASNKRRFKRRLKHMQKAKWSSTPSKGASPVTMDTWSGGTRGSCGHASSGISR